MAIKKIKLRIGGMTCDHCALSISKKISLMDGLISNRVSYTENVGEFQFEDDKVSKSEIIEAINSIGQYKVLGEIGIAKNETNELDLIIIGGGSAAFAAAIKASELGKKVLMINEGLPIGGTCVNVGCVPSKTLIRNAEQLHIAKHPTFSSIKNSDGEIDFGEAIRQKNSLVDKLRGSKYIDVLKGDSNVRILKSYGKLVDKNTVEAGGEEYTAKKILIATGSSTFIPDIRGLNEIDYLTNETAYYLEEIPERLIIIGGRYIALENAQLFSRFGSKVTLLQRSSRILPDEMPDLTESLKGYLEEEGIEIKTGVKVRYVENKNGKVIVNALIEGEDVIIEGTHIFIATGRKGNTLNLGLEEFGVEFHNNHFIKTDDFLQTSVPNIYAAGDVTGEYLFVYSAAYEGALAVENMFGGNTHKKDYSVFPWVIFTDPQVAGVGMDENQASRNNIAYQVSKIKLTDIPRSLAGRNTKGFIKLIRDKENDKLIGARILASEGSELLMEVSLAIKYGITVKELKQMFHPYLTLSEGIKIAAIGFDKDVNKLSCCAV